VLAGGELIIEWDAYLVDSVKVEHYISGADTDWVLDEIVPAANTPYTWTAPDTTTHDCNIRITAVGADIPSTSFRGFTLYEDPSWIADTPAEFSLSHPYPNPFNPSTTIDYALPSTSHVRMTVYNAMGQEVAELVDDRQAAGRYTVQWNAAGLSSGVYFYRIEAGEFMETGKMLLMK
jgi:hypothetical protein